MTQLEEGNQEEEGDKMTSSKENKFYSLFKGLNIWTFILLAMFFWSTFIVPALAKGFATQEDLNNLKVDYCDETTAIKEETREKIKDLRAELKESVERLEDKLDKMAMKSDDKIDKIYNLLVSSKRR